LLHDGIQVDPAVFRVGDHDLRGILSALVSSEVDVDRMDYLLRDSYFTGVSYGKFDHDWMLSHLTHHVTDDGRVFLALKDRAIYTFDDFLLSRYHMFLMVYFHSKVVCYDHMLRCFFERYPQALQVPPDPEAFLHFDDAAIYAELRRYPDSIWAQGILRCHPLQVIAECGPHARFDPLDALEQRLKNENLQYLRVTSKGALSKYRGKADETRTIYVQIKPRVGNSRFIQLSEATRLFDRYADAAILERVYVHHLDEERVANWIRDLRGS
jgi:hypothetical protein